MSCNFEVTSALAGPGMLPPLVFIFAQSASLCHFSPVAVLHPSNRCVLDFPTNPHLIPPAGSPDTSASHYLISPSVCLTVITFGKGTSHYNCPSANQKQKATNLRRVCLKQSSCVPTIPEPDLGRFTCISVYGL